MNVASLELSKTLLELSGWDDTDDSWAKAVGEIPAYDLGYLLRKLPAPTIIRHRVENKKYNKRPEWGITFGSGGGRKLIIGGLPNAEADTPEDAACQLAIDLFKQGVLKKERA